MRHRLSVDRHDFSVDRHDFSVDRHDFSVDRHDFRWPLAFCISSCVLRYFFGRRNPYFCMR